MDSTVFSIVEHVHILPNGLTTYETSVLEHLLLAVLLCPEVSKCVNDDTKDEVLNDDKDDQKEEGEIVEDTNEEEGFLEGGNKNSREEA